MTDTSVLLPNAQSLPSECLYNLAPSAFRSRSYRASVPTSNKSTFSPGDTAILYIPGGRRNTYLDTTQSYVRFTVKNNDTSNTLNFDGCGASVINRLDTFSGSNLISTIQQYNVLYNYILDIQMNQASRIGLSAAYGFDPTTLRKGNSIGTSGQQTCCIPLLGPMGLGSLKYIPIGLLCDDVRLELTFEQTQLGMVYSSSTTPVAWSIISCELELCIIELSDEAESYVRSVTPPEHPIYIHIQDWRHYASTVPSGSSGSYSTLVPARFASIKSLVACPRNAASTSGSTTVYTSYSVSSRINPNISTYWWRVGSSIMPSKYVVLENSNTTGGYGEAFEEVIKAWHSVGSYYISTQIPITYYNVADQGTLTNTPLQALNASGSTTYQNAFVIAQELESFANKDSLLMSGLNTLSSQVFFECTINTAVGSNSYVLNFFANFDSILVLENGLLSTRF